MHASWNQRKQSKRPKKRTMTTNTRQVKPGKEKVERRGSNKWECLLSPTMQTDMYDMISSHFHHLALKQETADINFFAVLTTPNSMTHNNYVRSLLLVIQLSGYSINSGRTFLLNSSGVKNPRATVASFNVVPSL